MIFGVKAKIFKKAKERLKTVYAGDGVDKILEYSTNIYAEKTAKSTK